VYAFAVLKKARFLKEKQHFFSTDECVASMWKEQGGGDTCTSFRMLSNFAFERAPVGTRHVDDGAGLSWEIEGKVTNIISRKVISSRSFFSVL
jgi:hypothetical protein